MKILLSEKKPWRPPRAKHFLSSNWGLLYAKESAWKQGANATNDKLIQVRGAEIFSKKVKKSDGLVWCSLNSKKKRGRQDLLHKKKDLGQGAQIFTIFKTSPTGEVSY